MRLLFTSQKAASAILQLLWKLAKSPQRLPNPGHASENSRRITLAPGFTRVALCVLRRQSGGEQTQLNPAI
jgi:hypothetical protein